MASLTTPQASIPQYTPPPPTYTLPAGAKLGGFNTSGVFGSSSVQPTASGGISFSPTAAASYSKPAVPTTPSVPTATASGLGQFVTNTSNTSGGGSITTDATGNATGYTSGSGFTIPTSGNVSSNSLTNPVSAGGLQQSYGSYQDYVNSLAQAQGYSPAYIQAYQQQQAAQTQGAQLGLNQANIANQFYNGGPNIPGGATVDYLSGITAKAQSQNTLAQAGNQVQQLAANQALNTQTLARTGNIAAAQTQLQYSPAGMTGSNAIDQYNSLQQQYPGAGIPSYNPSLSPEQNQQIAQSIVSQSPAYRAGFQSTYATPGGGTGIYSKLDVGSGGFQQNADGSYTLVPAAAAALGSANANIVQNQMSNLSNINSAIDSSGKTIQTMTQFMNQYGLNQSSVPIVNQIQNSVNGQLNKAGALAALKVDLNTLQSDYTQFLIGRGGSVAGSNQEAADAIPSNISPDQINQLYSQMKTDGQNTADAISTQVNQALQGIQTNTNSSTSTGGGSSTTAWPGWNP